MKKRSSICRYLIATILSVAPTVFGDSRSFDPLAFPKDREVPPQSDNQHKVSGPSPFVFKGGVFAKQVTGGPGQKPDSAGPVVFRVQLMTNDLYAEAKRAAKVAEEIFDQPVLVDYEVPNFKVRVGAFGSRAEAEQYLVRVKNVGYPSALVVSAASGVRQLPAASGSEAGTNQLR